MRRLMCAIGLAVLAACGGSTPPPPPAPGPPASITVQTGNNQEAAPGATVGTPISVVVKDAGGRPVPGAAVAFSVDSGNGSVASSAATTGSDGLASPGAWTMGPGEGSNVLAATAGTASVQVHAQARFPTVLIADQETIGPGGGTISYTKVGDPLSGFALTVPVGAYPTSQVWTVSGKPHYPVTLPDGVRQVGGAIVIGNDQGFANGLLAIRIPARVGLDTAVSALIYDPSTGYLEGMGVAARDSVSITAITRHVGSRFLWQPAPRSLRAPGGSRAGSAFGQITIIVGAAVGQALPPQIRTAFKLAIDDWEFHNLGSILTPLGNAAGMALTELYHLNVVKPGTGRGLSGQLDSVPNFDWDNPQGIRLVSLVQKLFDQGIAPQAQGLYQAAKALAATGQVSLDSLTLQSTEVNLLATGKPQVLQLSNASGVTDEVVAYSATNSVLQSILRLVDPSQPGAAGDSAVFKAGKFSGVGIGGLVNGTLGNIINQIMPIGMSSVIPIASLDGLWQQLQAGTVGNGTFPALAFLGGDPANQGNPAVTGIFKTLLSSLKIEDDCPTCGGPNPALADIVNRLGATVPNPIPVAQGNNLFGLIGMMIGKFVDFQWLQVQAKTLTILPDTAQGIQGDTLKFVAHPQGLAPSGAVYTWDFGDGTTFTSPPGDSTAMRIYTGNPPPGGAHFAVTVTLRNPANAVIGRGNGHALVLEPIFVWSFQSAALQSSTLPVGGIGSDKQDTTIFNFVSTTAADLQANPANSALFLQGVPTSGPTCNAGIAFEQFPAGQVQTDSLAFNAYRASLGGCGGEPDVTGTLTMGPLGNGTIIGTAAESVNLPPDTIVPPGGSINATMTGKALAGTFSWKVRYSTGLGLLTFTFTAIQVRP